MIGFKSTKAPERISTPPNYSNLSPITVSEYR